MKQHILFAGIRASGKSTLGKLVAEKLGRDFYDLDYEILKTTKAETLYEMVKTHDLRELAQREHDILVKLLSSPEPIVVSTGGRTFSHKDMDIKDMNKKVAIDKAFVVVPVIDKEKLWDRIVLDQHKEHSNTSIERLRSNYEDALGYLDLYKRVADLVVETDGDEPEVTTDKIITTLNS